MLQQKSRFKQSWSRSGGYQGLTIYNYLNLHRNNNLTANFLKLVGNFPKLHRDYIKGKMMKLSKWSNFFSGCLLVIGMHGCSSDEEKPEPEEEVAAADGDAVSEEGGGEGGGEEQAAIVPEPAPQEAAVAAPPPVEPAPAIAPAASAGFSPGNYLFVKTAGLNVRKAPGKSGKVINKLGYGIKVNVLANEGIWIKVRENEWVSSSGLTTQYQYVNKTH